VPYTLGAIVGLVVVSNLLKWLLAAYERPMTALLIGVLWGSVIPVWPFRGETAAGEALAAAVAAALGFAGVYALSLWKPARA